MFARVHVCVCVCVLLVNVCVLTQYVFVFEDVCACVCGMCVPRLVCVRVHEVKVHVSLACINSLSQEADFDPDTTTPAQRKHGCLG